MRRVGRVVRREGRVDDRSGPADSAAVMEEVQPTKTQQARILEAAKTLFLSKGFNGSNLRDIAKSAKVSVGGIYHHFESKEEIYLTLLQQSDVAQDMFQILKLFQAPEFPENLAALGEAIARTVRKHKDSFKLFYIDVLEFQGKNVKPIISGFRDKFNELADVLLAKRQGDLAGMHPAIILRVMVDVFIHTRLEEAMLDQSVAQRLGISDEEMTRQMAELLLRGILKR